jgi:hypothetical protein
MLKSVQTTLLSLSEATNDIEQAKSEWGLFGDIEGGEFANSEWTCEACGQKPLKYRGLITNSENGNLLWVGQECALYFGVLKEGLKFPQYWKRQVLNRSIDELIIKQNPTIVQLGGQWLSKSAHDFALRNLVLGKKFLPAEVLYLVQRFEEEGILFSDSALAFWARSTIPQIKNGSCETLKMSDCDFDKINRFYSTEMIVARESVRAKERETARKTEEAKRAYLEAQKYTPASKEEKQRLALIRDAEQAQIQKDAQMARELREKEFAEQAEEQEREFLAQQQRINEHYTELKLAQELRTKELIEAAILSKRKPTQEEREQRLLLGIAENETAINAEKQRIKARQEKAEREMKAWREAQEKNKNNP